MHTSANVNDMKDIVETLKKHPRKTYSLVDVVSLKLMPWARDGRTVRRLIDEDFAGANLLQATVTGAATQRRYLLTGRGIIKYLQTYGPALMGTVRKNRKTYGKKRSGGGRKTEGS